MIFFQKMNKNLEVIRDLNNSSRGKGIHVCIYAALLLCKNTEKS